MIARSYPTSRRGRCFFPPSDRGRAIIGVIQASEAVGNPAAAFVSPLTPELSGQICCRHRRPCWQLNGAEIRRRHCAFTHLFIEVEPSLKRVEHCGCIRPLHLGKFATC